MKLNEETPAITTKRARVIGCLFLSLTCTGSRSNSERQKATRKPCLQTSTRRKSIWRACSQSLATILSATKPVQRLSGDAIWTKSGSNIALPLTYHGLCMCSTCRLQHTEMPVVRRTLLGMRMWRPVSEAWYQVARCSQYLLVTLS